MSEVELGNAFPLDWPAGYPRYQMRKRAAFKASVATARDQILKELRLMNVPDWNVIISTNVPVSSRTMQMLAMKAQPADPGVAVYFRKSGKPFVVACDKWDRLADNLRAIAVTIEAMRGMERWGCTEMLERAFQGFTALPPPPAPVARKEWWDVLGVDPRDSLLVIETMYKAKMKHAHPDAGGSHAAAEALNDAMAKARAARMKK